MSAVTIKDFNRFLIIKMSKPKSSMAEMERRLAELNAARTAQESALGLNKTTPPPTLSTNFVIAKVTRSGVDESVFKARVEELEKIKHIEALPASADMSAFGRKTRDAATTADIEKHMTEMDAERDAQNSEFARMVLTEEEEAALRKKAPDASITKINDSSLGFADL